MKSRKLTLLTITALLLIVGALTTATVFAAGHRSTEDVFLIADSTVLLGESSLTRTPNGVSMKLETTGLTLDDAVTIWWVIFNVPGSCAASPCALGDLGTVAVKADVLFGAGHVIDDAGGEGGFAGRLAEGDLSGSIGGALGLPAAQGLIDSTVAEVHLVVRTHGPKIPELLPAMINSFGGGCTAGSDPTGAGPVGPNVCEDIQASIHLP